MGAIDGKHSHIRCPPNAGSSYYNYKNTHIILLAITDASYCFTIVDVGAPGRESDSGILANSKFGSSLLNGELPLPGDVILTGTNIKSPHVFLGYCAFPLKPNLMKLFPQNKLNIERKVYNYRLSRARRIVENSFGILVARWRILARTMFITPSKAIKVVKAPCASLEKDRCIK